MMTARAPFCRALQSNSFHLLGKRTLLFDLDLNHEAISYFFASCGIGVLYVLFISVPHTFQLLFTDLKAGSLALAQPTTFDPSGQSRVPDGPFLNYTPPSNRLTVRDDALSSDDDSSGSNTAMLIAHGFLMSFAFVIFFPFFAIIVPIPSIPISVTKVHVPLQLFTLAMVIAGLGLGIELGVSGDLMKNAHPIIGLVVVGLLILFQPALGLLQHLHFKRTGGKGIFAYMHRWLGRFLIILGMVNGGLGFALSGVGQPGTPRGAMIGYSVIAGVLGSFYIGLLLFLAMRGK